eukprot:jgi/Tetstr1/424798/TSEL_015301.t1
MGIKGLWQALEPELERVEGAEDGDSSGRRLARLMDGAHVAVDLSMWILQAQEAGALEGLHAAMPSAAARIAKLIFERAHNWLRHGVVPVAVLEGTPPPEKLAVIRARFRARNGYDGGGGGGAWWAAQSRVAGDTLRAMGLPVVQAPGEAEATCGALNALGVVDGVATKDGDALLYGAETVYKELTLSAQVPRSSLAVVCRMASVRARLGCASGGADALVALAAMSGGDYDEGGARGVGMDRAMKLVGSLVAESGSEEGIVDKLCGKLAAPPDDALAALSRCTGCRLCGHDCGSTARKCTKNRGCSGCGTQPVAEGGNGAGGCVPAPPTRHQPPCGCAFHRLTLERQVDRVVRMVAGQPGFLDSMRVAADAYQRQRQMALRHVRRLQGQLPGGRFRWEGRPDMEALMGSMGHHIGWSRATIRRKVLPLLVEWDIAHAGNDGVEFCVKAIVKVNGQGEEAQAASWRYLLEVDCAPRPESRPQYPAYRDRKDYPPGGAAEEAAEAEAPQLTEREYDGAVLAKNRLARTVRMSLVDASLPEVVAAFQAKQRKKLEPPQPRVRARKASLQPPAGKPITNFFAVTKGANNTSAKGVSGDGGRGAPGHPPLEPVVPVAARTAAPASTAPVSCQGSAQDGAGGQASTKPRTPKRGASRRPRPYRRGHGQGKTLARVGEADGGPLRAWLFGQRDAAAAAEPGQPKLGGNLRGAVPEGGSGDDEEGGEDFVVELPDTPASCIDLTQATPEPRRCADEEEVIILS